MNLYTYVHNNPLRYTDPSGHWIYGPSIGDIWDGAVNAWNSGTDWAREENAKLSKTSSFYKETYGDNIEIVLNPDMSLREKGQRLLNSAPIGVLKGPGKGMVKIEGMPPIVQSRINISNDGFKHVVKEHFSTKNKSQFTISQDELRSILSDKDVVSTPITRTLNSDNGIRYVREVTFDKPIGLDKYNDFNPTSTMTILTDKSGNLITASPGIIK